MSTDCDALSSNGRLACPAPAKGRLPSHAPRPCINGPDARWPSCTSLTQNDRDGFRLLKPTGWVSGFPATGEMTNRSGRQCERRPNRAACPTHRYLTPVDQGFVGVSASTNALTRCVPVSLLPSVSIPRGPDRDSSAVTTWSILPRRILSRHDSQKPCARQGRSH